MEGRTMTSQINYRRHLKSLRENRDSWLELLNKNPDNLAAAEKVAMLNSQIQYIQTLKLLDGDYEDEETTGNSMKSEVASETKSWASSPRISTSLLCLPPPIWTGE